MTTIGEFTDQVRAGIVQSFLNDNDIDAVLLDQGASAWTAGRLLIPIRLAVPANQAPAARRLLEDFGSDEHLTDE